MEQPFLLLNYHLISLSFNLTNFRKLQNFIKQTKSNKFVPHAHSLIAIRKRKKLFSTLAKSDVLLLRRAEKGERNFNHGTNNTHNISIRHQKMPSRASELTIKATRKAFSNPTHTYTHIMKKFSSRKCKASGEGGGWLV